MPITPNIALKANAADVAAALAALPFSHEHLATYAPSGVAAVDVAFSGAFEQYILVLDAVMPVTDGVLAYLYLSTNGGATYAVSLEHQMVQSNATTMTGMRDTDSKVALNGTNGISVGNAAGEGLSAVIDFLSPLSTARKSRGIFRCAFTNPSTQTQKCDGIFNSGSGSLEDWTHARFAFSSGNIASGNIHLYGVSPT